jgi:hypothetical protein
MKLKNALDILETISEKSRLRMINLIANFEGIVNQADILRILDMHQSSIARHLISIPFWCD